MKRRTSLAHQYVEFIPKDLEEGVLYISKRFRTASHLCCCGCATKVPTPLNVAKWTLTDHGDTVSLSPSVGLGSLACRSHYWIRGGQIDWYRNMTDRQTDRARHLDEIASRRLTGELSSPQPHTEPARARVSWWGRFLAACGLRPRN